MYTTLSEACRAWVNEFNAIPQSALMKIAEYDMSIREITPPAVYNSVYICDGKYSGKSGIIIKTLKNDRYEIKLDNDMKKYRVIDKENFEVTNDDFWPMWGTMWSFGDKIDEEWLVGEYGPSYLTEMANCGFRIYETEDFGIVFGIDGCGYDFFEAHWIPLYKLRGLHWHKTDDTVKEAA